MIGQSPEAASRRALEIVEKYGSEAPEYAASRVEASRLAGEEEDVRMWSHVAQLLSNRPHLA